MGFGTELQGRASHEALIHLQDTEIRLLDSIRKCISHRIKSDRDYATSLTSMVNAAQKFEVAPEFDTPVYKAWTAVIKETEFLAHLIRTNADKLCGKTLEQIVLIINEKRSSRKFYVDERSRLETEYTKLQTEVSRLKSDYERLAVKLNQDKNKYEDLCSKGKGGSKVENAKQKYCNSESKLQKVHNEYVTHIIEANLHSKIYSETTLPGLLDYQKESQEGVVQLCKGALNDYAELTNHSADNFAKCHEQIFKHIGSISPSKEYNEFIAIKKTEPLPLSTLTFSDNLLQDYKGTLVKNEIALNNLTVEQIKLSRSTYEDQMVKCRERLPVMKARLHEAETEADKSSTQSDKDNKIGYHLLRQQISDLKRQIAELSCQEEKFKALYNLLNEPLARLVDSDMPHGITFPENAAFSKDDSGSQSSQSGPSKTHNTFSTIKSAISKKIVKRQQNTIPPTPPSRDFVDVQVNGEEGEFETCSEGAANNKPPVSKTDSVGDGYQQMTVNPNRELDEEDWYHGVLPREEVQKLLVNDGDYLVRASVSRKTGDTQYVLSVQWQGHKHFIIQGSKQTGWRFEGESYPTIQGLIMQQHKCGLPVTKKSEAILQTPILKEDWELRNDDIVLGQKIGNGNFGDVFRGNYKPKKIQVAVKTCRETLSDDAKKKFLQEGRILKQFKHPNIVEFIGIAAQKQPVMIVMEYVPGGSLLNFLRKKGIEQSQKTLIQMCIDAASGMKYLESKNCIHRDLAARNCLVGKENVVKISDFGMSREEEEYTVSGGLKQIPIKWTAPEALNYGRYTNACDVWSYGILVWEIYSFGAVPYPGMTNQQAKEKVDEGFRLPAPSGTPVAVYDCVKKCWQQDDRQRPRFADIYEELSKIHVDSV